MRVAVVQMDCILGDVEANLRHIERLAADAVRDHGADLVILPECATTGYFVGDRARSLATTADGPMVTRLVDIATRLGRHLAVGLIEADGASVYDSLALLAPRDGLLAMYRKVHLFAGERAVFSAGDEPCLVDTALGRIGLTVCYDLMFPEYVRGLVLGGAELIVNGTDWITDPWQTGMGWTGESVRALARTRALENSVHVAMAARVGEEAGFTSVGHSTIASPTGAVLATLDDGEGIAAARLADPTADLDRWRGYASYLADRQPGLYARMGRAEP
ncbi:MAG: carbon-nitrogen hydrolase family protein [Chloroflexota bacterium]